MLFTFAAISVFFIPDCQYCAQRLEISREKYVNIIFYQINYFPDFVLFYEY